VRPAAALLLVVAACSRPSAAPSPANQHRVAPSAQGLRPGERATYVITAAGIEVGEAAFAVGWPSAGTLAVASRSGAVGLLEAFGAIDAEVETRIDLTSGRPLTLTGLAHVAGQPYRGDGRFEATTAEMTWFDGRDGGQVAHRYHSIEDGVIHSPHTAMAAVRDWEGAPGDWRRLDLVGALNLWRANLTWIGRETIGTALGNQLAVRVDGDCANPGGDRVTFSIWMSDDLERVPLRVEAQEGIVKARFEITSYEP
jgi:hypothetical protein